MVIVIVKFLSVINGRLLSEARPVGPQRNQKVRKLCVTSTTHGLALLQSPKATSYTALQRKVQGFCVAKPC